jgi:hypothetical protein
MTGTIKRIKFLSFVTLNRLESKKYLLLNPRKAIQ